MRKSEIKRKTGETDIVLTIDLDGAGKSDVCTGCGFLDHMLELFSRHGRFDLSVSCTGDTNVDYHHTVEDVGICLGKAFSEALGDRRGITRYASIAMPMDEALTLAAADISGRGVLGYALEIPTEKVGDFDCELACEFFSAFVREGGITLHLRSLAGENSHHIIESAFKGAAVALRHAVRIDSEHADDLPSTKGVL